VAGFELAGLEPHPVLNPPTLSMTTSVTGAGNSSRNLQKGTHPTLSKQECDSQSIPLAVHPSIFSSRRRVDMFPTPGKPFRDSCSSSLGIPVLPILFYTRLDEIFCSVLKIKCVPGPSRAKSFPKEREFCEFPRVVDCLPRDGFGGKQISLLS